jgi:hypothetical protein
MVIVA